LTTALENAGESQIETTLSDLKSVAEETTGLLIAEERNSWTV
jgi:hypothetical protein